MKNVISFAKVIFIICVMTMVSCQHVVDNDIEDPAYRAARKDACEDFLNNL